MMRALTHALFAHLHASIAARRPPDFIVGADAAGGAYLERWYITPWRHWQTRLRARAQRVPSRARRFAAWAGGLLPNLYLHHFLRDDDDRALHDHPSWAASLILDSSYIEHTIDAGGIHRHREYRAGALRLLPIRHAHRIELPTAKRWEQGTGVVRTAIPCWTLFLMGPTVRAWGFHCPQRGWVPWQEFTAAGKPGEIGPGCD